MLIQVLGEAFTQQRNFIGLRKKDYMYARYRNGDEELYDLARDPYQLISRHNDPAYGTVLNQLRGELDAQRDSADVSISATTSPTIVAPGEVATTQLRITNHGSVIATNVYVRYTVPNRFEQRSCSGSREASCVSSGANREIRYMVIDPGETVTARIVFAARLTAANGQQNIPITAESFNTRDPTSSNNTALVSITVASP